MYCKNCGNQLNEGAKFCGICGTPVVQDNNINNQGVNQTSIEQTATQIPQQNFQQPVVDQFQQQNFQQPVAYNQAPAKPASKAPLIIVIILVVIFGFFFVGAIGLAVYITIANEGLEEILNDYNSSEKITLVHHDISFEYNDSWTKQPEDNGIIALTRTNETIKIAYDTSDYYYTTTSLTTSVKKSFEDEGFTIVEDAKEITINNQKWQMFICENDDYRILALVLANDYDQYAFTYTAKSTNFDDGMSNIEKIYKTLKLDTSKQKESEKKAKEKLIGEWDWGISGYFVIENDKIYLYKDSSKSMDNVFYGTYTADDKVATYAAGYTEGMHVIMTVEKYYFDGEERDLNSNSNKLEFVFVPNNDGTYMIKNMVSYQYNTATKVK